MTESNQRDAWIEAELRSLQPSARDVLAVLAVCGRVSLSVDELAEITELPEVRVTLAELEQRSLVVRDGDRYSLAPPARGPLQRLLGTLDVVDRVLRGFIHIAEDGRLTLDDLDAVVELTGIAAEFGRWKELLRLAEAAETTLSTKHRVDEWVKIAERRGEAERELEDEGAHGRAERDLDRLGASGPSSGAVRLTLAALAVAAAGVVAGLLIGSDSSGNATETITEETITEVGTAETVTEAGETVTTPPSTITSVVTVTVTPEP